MPACRAARSQRRPSAGADAIALLGTRGIPARYGGFETSLKSCPAGWRAGHQVTVYCRERHPSRATSASPSLPPDNPAQILRTVAHTFLSTLRSARASADVALYCNAANAIFTWMPRLSGMPVAFNVDGLERKRKKWNALAQSLVPRYRNGLRR